MGATTSGEAPSIPFIAWGPQPLVRRARSHTPFVHTNAVPSAAATVTEVRVCQGVLAGARTCTNLFGRQKSAPGMGPFPLGGGQEMEGMPTTPKGKKMVQGASSRAFSQRRCMVLLQSN